MFAACQPSALRPQPLLPGWIEAFYRRHNGKRLGPYHVRKWKANGKVHREYIKPKDLERVRAACQANRDKRKQTIQANKSGFVFKGNWDFMHRIATRAEKGKPITLEEVAHVLRIQREGWDAPDGPKLRRK